MALNSLFYADALRPLDLVPSLTSPTNTTLHKRHRFWDIRLQICRDLEGRVRGPSRSLKRSPFDRAHMTSYWRSIVTMVLSLVVSEILNVEKYRDLEIPVKGQSRSLRVVPFDRMCMVSY